MANSGQTEQLYKSRSVLLELLKNRGFNISNYEGSSVTEIHGMQQAKQLDMLMTNDDNKKVYVKFHITKNLRAQNLYEYVEDLFELENLLGKNDDLIIVIRDEPNDTLRQILRNIWAQEKVFVSVFNIQRLQFNIMKHELVPPHRILSETEDNDFRSKYNIKDDLELPDISRFSPVSLAIGMRPGQICEILRPSRTAIKTKFYRICSA